MVLQVLCIALLVPAVPICLYHVVLACCALAGRRPVRAAEAQPTHRFAIVIPAHNEEATLAGVLRSCAELDYPRDLYQVYVIADNCSDATAAIARAGGARCLERHDDKRRGKGAALEWAFERVLPDGADAIVVLDADCTLDAHALRAFDRRLAAGDRVLQACNVASNPDTNVTSYVACVANTVENHLFYAPKSDLGLAVLLRGTGMVFAREVLQSHPWRAHSIVEDSEYSVRLLEAGLRIRFVPEASVRSPFATHSRQLSVQRKRWVGGNAHFGRAHALRLMGRGLIGRRWLLLDLGWTLLAVQRSLVLVELLLAVLVGGLCDWLAPGKLSAGLALTGVALGMLHGLILALGAVLLGLNGRRLRFLAGSPLVAARMLLIAVQGACGDRVVAWQRTPR